MSQPLTKAERAMILARATTLESELYPPEGGPPEPTGRKRVKMLDTYYQVLHEYGDRLPRVPVSRCPQTKQVLKRVLDPFGLDGPFWFKSRVVEIEEPPAPLTFKVLLGALDLRGRTPHEAQAEIIPGPEVPFVVPSLLELPGMRAVISRIDLEQGDIAHLIAYFSGEDIPMQDLHQHWLEQDLWYPGEGGGTSWLTKNDPYEYDLAPWIENGRLAWIEPGDLDLTVYDRTSARSCPYVALEGDQHPQSISGGERELLEIPDGSPVDPFE